MKNTMTVRMNGRTEEIPQAWLVGASYTFTRQGMSHKAATVAAIAQWFEQGDMAAEFSAQRAAKVA